MCGIVGLAGRSNFACLEVMNELITHRGPDDAGIFVDEEMHVGLAMRRLSILDLASGHQPMCNEDKSVWIVFNGEIFNSPELRNQLVNRHVFKTENSDTEVLIHLYEECGESMVDVLNGMFAFVIYDQRKRILFGARDHTGIKPLYFFNELNQFAFSSEIKSLLSLPGFERSICQQSLYHYLSLRYVPGTESIFENITRLPAGCRFFYDLQTYKLDIESYWDLHFEAVKGVGEAEWCERIRHNLKEAAHRWTLSDVPIGCSLSGGLDSTAIVGLLSENGSSNIKTYSLGFEKPEEAGISELPLARQVAEKWGTDHHELILSPDALLDDLISMVWYLDEPYGGGLPSWYVFQFMSQDVKVGLTGSGGDELFGNYGKFYPMEKRGLARSRQAASRVIGWGGAHSKFDYDYWEAIKAVCTVHFPKAYKHPLSLYEYLYFTDREKESLLVKTAGLVETVDFMANIGSKIDPRRARDQVMYFDFKNQLPEEFLMMTDRFSLAHSLEARVPFLDRQFVEFVLQIPASIRAQDGDPKGLLRKSIGDLLPNEVRDGAKRGFVVPTGLWLRGRLRKVVDRLLSEEYLEKQGIFRPDFYTRFVKPHLEGKAERGERIWPILMFQLWHLVFIKEACQSKPTFRLQDIC